MSEDRRRETREPVTLKVEYQGAAELLSDYTENISRSGTFVMTQRDLDPGTRLEIVLSFPGLVEPIRLSGVVRWSRREPADEQGVGVEFDALPAAERARLDALVQRIGRRDPALVVRTLRVLIVEDNPHVAELLEQGLHASGKKGLDEKVDFRCTVVDDGKRALDLIARERFDLLLVDIYMPVMDGAQVIRHVKGTPDTAAIPVVAVSAGGPEARDQAMAAGADFYLDKPIRLSDVVRTMRTLLQR